MKNQEKDLKNENTGSTEKKVDKRRVDSFMSKNEETRAEIRRVYENGRRRT